MPSSPEPVYEQIHPAVTGDRNNHQEAGQCLYAPSAHSWRTDTEVIVMTECPAYA